MENKTNNMKIWQPIITLISMLVSYFLYFNPTSFILKDELYWGVLLYGFFGGIGFLIWGIKNRSSASIILSILHIIPFAFTFFLFLIFATVGFAP